MDTEVRFYFASIRFEAVCGSKATTFVKSSNLKRHYETKHSKFESMYQQKTEERKNKIDQLKLQYERSVTILVNSMTVQAKATECSLRIAWILKKHKKPFLLIQKLLNMYA